jgi:hypothetical protein
VTGDGRSEPSSAPELFEAIAATYAGRLDVEGGTGFGNNPGLRAGGRIFAMLGHGALVVKLPAERVARLISTGEGIRFDPGHGRLMREWIVIPTRLEAEWAALVEEAYAFVSSMPPSCRRS